MYIGYIGRYGLLNTKGIDLNMRQLPPINEWFIITPFIHPIKMNKAMQQPVQDSKDKAMLYLSGQ
jgi:hypothetical protein